MTGPPSTLRTTPANDPAHQGLDEDVSPSLQQLIRLQIFTPMTLLLALGSNLVTTFAFHPNTGRISDEYETIWTPRKEFIGGYLLLVSVAALAWCSLRWRAWRTDEACDVMLHSPPADVRPSDLLLPPPHNHKESPYS